MQKSRLLTKEFLLLLIAVILAAAIRLDLLIANNFTIDSDEAIVGLMAKHIMEGKTFPTFYYGQHYMGSLEAICAAFVFKFFGISSAGLKIVPFAFSLLMVILIYDLTLQFASKRAALIAAYLCALPPSALVVWSSMARGGFIELIVLGTLSFCLLARWLKNHDKKLIFCQGLILGVGWWVNNQIIYFMLPTGLAIAANILFCSESTDYYRKFSAERLIRLLKTSVLGLFAWFIGSLPFWIYNIQNQWSSFGMFAAAKESKLIKHIEGFFTQALPILLGGSRFWQVEDIYPGSVKIAAIIYISLFLFFCVVRFSALIRVLKGQFDKDSFPEILFIFLVCCACVFVFSSFGWLSQAPRYLLPMYAGIFPLLGLVLDRSFNYSKLVTIFIFGLLIVANLSSSYFGGRVLPGEPIVYKGSRVSKDHSELIKWLDDHKISYVRTNYWIGYRLAFETLEKTKFIVSHEPTQTRIQEWADSVSKEQALSFPFIAVPLQAKHIRKGLELMHIEYKEQVLSGYHLFYDLRPVRPEAKKVSPQNIEMSVNYKSESISKAYDGDLTTRWGSGTPQKPDMQVEVNFKEPVNLSSLHYELGNFTSDFPRALQIDFIMADGTHKLYFSPGDWESLTHLMQLTSELELYFPGQLVKTVILMQTSRDAIFDWSIAELEFFEVLQ